MQQTDCFSTLRSLVVSQKKNVDAHEKTNKYTPISLYANKLESARLNADETFEVPLALSTALFLCCLWRRPTRATMRARLCEMRDFERPKESRRLIGKRELRLRLSTFSIEERSKSGCKRARCGRATGAQVLRARQRRASRRWRRRRRRLALSAAVLRTAAAATNRRAAAVQRTQHRRAAAVCRRHARRYARARSTKRYRRRHDKRRRLN